MFHFGAVGFFALLVILAPCHRVTVSSSRAAEEEQTLLSAGLSGDGPALLAFFHARARTDLDAQQLRQLLRRFADGPQEERNQAAAELLGLGPLALPALRQTANDLDHPDLAQRALRCLPWLEGPASSKLLIAAAHTLAQRKPEGAAAALLAYLPFALDAEVIAAVNAALIAVAAPEGKADPALLRGLEDALAVRRAAACVALCRAAPPEQVPEVRKLLKDPAPAVRQRAALALAEAHDAEAIPVLIDLLADLDAQQRQPIEEFLTQLAGEWAPVVNFAADDKIARKIRRDAWAAWWKNTNGEALLEALREHTLTDEARRKVRDLLSRLGSDDFGKREVASRDLFALGRITLPQLREALKDKDAEVARRAKLLIDRIEREPAHRLPAAAVRLLGVRKPDGAAAALLAYLPHAEEDNHTDEVQKSLAVLALREGKPEPALLRALDDERPTIRAVAAEALIQSGREGRAACRELLKDKAAIVRMRVALALAVAGEREAVVVLIDLLTSLPAEQAGQVEASLYQLAGETAPEVSAGTDPAERQKCRDAWVAWWKVNAKRADLTRLSAQPLLGYTLVCNDGRNRVFEVDRQGKERWGIDNVPGPVDAVILPGNRVLIAECNASRVSERDFKGKILWQRQTNAPVNIQRLPNGHTFIAGQGHIEEVDRNGKVLYSINNVPGGVLAAYRSRKGSIVCLTNNGQCLFLDTTGKQLKSFASGHDSNCLGGLDLLPNDHVLVAQPARNKVAEFDSEGRKVWEVDAAGATMATKLPNGHILAAGRNTSRVFEVDRAGKVVWEKRYTGQVFRVRRR
jgi:HEAT repeat protein